jgi:hypothetical protein
MFDLHAVSIFATGTGESETTTLPLFASCREIINIMTMMMKTIKRRLNLYAQNILMGWGPVYF